MTHDRLAITGRERRFSADEFIVSKTNAKGIITYANDVFLRIADYKIEEVLGKPHNIIRHPHMPKCVFRLLWQQIKNGQEIFAYVVNRTKYGDHYWVLAHVTPSFDQSGAIVGYHSNRRAPDPKKVELVEPLYKELCQIEDKALTPQAGVEASMAALQAWVNENGGNYDSLILSL